MPVDGKMVWLVEDEQQNTWDTVLEMTCGHLPWKEVVGGKISRCGFYGLSLGLSEWVNKTRSYFDET